MAHKPYSRALLQHAFGVQHSLHDIQYTEWGKPYLHGGPGFNIAHSGNIIACGVLDGGNVGVDVEEMKHIAIDELADHFTKDEWTVINTAVDRQAAFYRMWVRKEAVTKAIGKGMGIPLETIDMCGDSIVYEEGVYYLHDVYVCDGYAACVAADREIGTVTITEIAV